MKKSIYSLVLSDDVVEAVDELAAGLGLSRSAMINRILAEKVALRTPEMRINDIIGSVREEMEKLFSLTAAGTGTVAARSPLKYKYNPTVRYYVELRSANGEKAGELRAILRTQNSELIKVLNGFFGYWAELERLYFSARLKKPPAYRIEDGKFTRSLNIPADIPDEALGKAVAGYAELLDKGLKIYLKNLPDYFLAEQETKMFFSENSDKNYYLL